MSWRHWGSVARSIQQMVSEVFQPRNLYRGFGLIVSPRIGVVMPRYFSNYRINGILEKAPEGTDLPWDESALDEARTAARELLAVKVLSASGRWG